jgi:hypothetical protein
MFVKSCQVLVGLVGRRAYAFDVEERGTVDCCFIILTYCKLYYKSVTTAIAIATGTIIPHSDDRNPHQRKPDRRDSFRTRSTLPGSCFSLTDSGAHKVIIPLTCSNGFLPCRLSPSVVINECLDQLLFLERDANALTPYGALLIYALLSS